MKKIFLGAFILASSFSAFAQDTENTEKTTSSTEKQSVKEVGLVFSGLNNYGLTLRAGSNKVVFRLNTLVNEFSSSKNAPQSSTGNDSKNTKMSGNLRLGIEFRKKIADKLEIRYGIDGLGGYSSSTTTVKNFSVYGDETERTTKNTGFDIGTNFVFGFNYISKSNIVFGAEILPGIVYSTAKTTNSNTTGNGRTSNNLNIGFNSSAAMLTLLYRF